jgi:hypothetical protein
MARINAVQQRQAFSLPFLNAEYHNSPTLQPHRGSQARCCWSAPAVGDGPPCAHFRRWSQPWASFWPRRAPPTATEPWRAVLWTTSTNRRINQND